MTHVMTPSGMTPGQIAKVQENLGAALRKAGFLQGPSQIVLETQGDSFIAECVSAFRKRVEVQGNLIARSATPNRKRTPQAALEATNCRLCVDVPVIASMPRGNGNEVEVIFFKPGRVVSDDDLEKEYELRGLVPADPYSLATVNEDDPAFADEHPNATHWKDSSGRWCYVAFNRWGDGHGVYVGRHSVGWSVGWRFAGLRK